MFKNLKKKTKIIISIEKKSQFSFYTYTLAFDWILELYVK